MTLHYSSLNCWEGKGEGKAFRKGQNPLLNKHGWRVSCPTGSDLLPPPHCFDSQQLPEFRTRLSTVLLWFVVYSPVGKGWMEWTQMVLWWRSGSWSFPLLPPWMCASSMLSSDGALRGWFLFGHLSSVCDIIHCFCSLFFSFIFSLFLFWCSTHLEVIPIFSKKCGTKVNANLSTKTFGQNFWVSLSIVRDGRISGYPET